MFSFQHIEYLYVLAAIPLLVLVFLLAINKKKKIANKIGEPHLVSRLTKNYSPSKYALKFILIIGAYGALGFGLANLQRPAGGDGVTRNGIDIMIALDVSNSMMAQDIKPSRLERARQVLGRVIDRLQDDRIGIVIFAGKAYLQMPLTSDHAAAKMYLSAASPESVPTQGTVINDALRMSYSAFNSNDKKYKAIILVSDGEDHDEGAIETATQVADDGVVIHTVGIGSPQGAPIPDDTDRGYKKDLNGNAVVSKLNEEGLRTIAQKANGRYQLFTNADAVVSNLVADLSTMDQRPVTDKSLLNYEKFFQYFLAFALLLLLVELIVSEKRSQILSRVSPKMILFFTILFAYTGSMAQGSNIMILKGNEAYKKKEYDKASAEYKNAIKTDASNPVAQYNLGSALYKSGKKDEALSAYDKSMAGWEKPIDKSNTYYNKGVVYQNNQQINECISMYKKALKINPNDEDARQNLQKALQKQKPQQKQNDQNKENKSQGANKNQPKQQPAKMSKQDAEEKLKSLNQQERSLQDKLHKVKASAANKPEKDW